MDMRTQLEQVEMKAFTWYMESQRGLLERKLSIESNTFILNLLEKELGKVDFCLKELKLFNNPKEECENVQRS